jgi:hypothetical protein
MVPQFIKAPNAPVRLDLEESKKISKLYKEFAEFKSLIEQEAPQQLLRARKKGGGGTASATLVGRYGLRSDGEVFIFDIINASLDKAGNGLIEFVLYDQYGTFLYNTVGVLQKNTLTFMLVFINGAQLVNLALDPKKDYGGSGIVITELIAECQIDSGNDFVNRDETYSCQYRGSQFDMKTVELFKASR